MTCFTFIISYDTIRSGENMKKKIIIYTVSIIAFLAIAIVSIIGGINTHNKKVLKQELNNLIESYDANETLSYKNYLINSTHTNVTNNNGKYTFNYKNKQVTITEDKIVKISNTTVPKYDYSFDSVEDMVSSPKLKVDDIVYVKSYYKNKNIGGGYYTIVNARDDNSYCIDLDLGLVAQLKVYDKTIYVSQLGAYADGKTDDHTAIQQSIDLCGENIDTIIFDKGNYLCNDYIDIINVSNINIIGNNSTIIVNDQFNTVDTGEFFFNVYGSEDILISGLNINYDFNQQMRGIRTQLVINASDNIELYGCKLTIPKSLREVSQVGYTNIDCYSDWHNIIINNCTFTNYCDCEEGGGMWIRDLHNKGCDNIKVVNSSFTKVAHDEILAVFMGQISNVLIKNNTFNVPDTGLSSSVMNFTLGSSSSVQAENITFSDNTIDASSTGGLIWSKNTKNLVVKNNNIKTRLSSKADGSNTQSHFRVFESQSNSDGVTKKINSIENNTIEVYSYLDTYNFQYKIFSNINNVKSNNITIYPKVTNIFIGCDNVINNKVTNNSDVEFVSYNTTTKFSNNSVILKGYTSCMFRWYGYTLNKMITCSNNSINYQYVESEKSSCIVMINNTKFVSNTIDFNNNLIAGTTLSPQTRQLFVVADDEKEQQFLFKNNIVTNYPDRNYVVNAQIVKD